MSFSIFLHTLSFFRNQVSLQFSSISMTAQECKYKHRYSGKIHKSCRKRTSALAFRREGILTVEAGMCIALFMFAALSLMSLFQMTEDFAEKQYALTQSARKQSLCIEGKDAVEIDVLHRYKPAMLMFGEFALPLRHKVYIKYWTGYKPVEKTGDASDNPTIYYVTDYESVYHTTKACSHLQLSIRLIHLNRADSTVNVGGKNYTPCEKCGGAANISGNYYVTDEGGRYHTSLSCSGLKRTIHQITDIQGMSPCSRCG